MKARVALSPQKVPVQYGWWVVIGGLVCGDAGNGAVGGGVSDGVGGGAAMERGAAARTRAAAMERGAAAMEAGTATRTRNKKAVCSQRR